MSEIVFSIDDVKGIFKALREEHLGSIFDTRALSFFKFLHEEYGVSFILYCSCKSDDYKMEEVSEHYRNEFIENSNWLKFGFHCYVESGFEYEISDFINHYEYYVENIYRITGQAENVMMLRLHAFVGNKEICEFLKRQGVNVLFSADDQRVSYYLDEKQNTVLQNNRQFYDEDIDLLFIRSCTRLEKAENICEEIQEYRKMNIPVIPVFTHEWLLDDVSIRKKLEECCKHID